MIYIVLALSTVLITLVVVVTGLIFTQKTNQQLIRDFSHYMIVEQFKNTKDPADRLKTQAAVRLAEMLRKSRAQNVESVNPPPMTRQEPPKPPPHPPVEVECYLT